MFILHPHEVQMIGATCTVRIHGLGPENSETISTMICNHNEGQREKLYRIGNYLKQKGIKR